MFCLHFSKSFVKMGKKHHEERSKKKQKHHRQTEKRSPKIIEPIMDSSSTNQEEITFDINDDCVEVEITEESQEDLLQPTMTPPVQSPKPSSSRKTTPKQILPPSPAANNTSLNTKLKNKKRRDSGTSSEEERWLTAIESGKLDDVDDELKKMKDPKLMTARQRAMYERGVDKEATTETPFVDMLMALPTGYREKPQTVENEQKRLLKVQKRKQMADEKREKDKQKTMDRLLNKKDSKQRATARGKAAAKSTVPMISYKNTETGAFITLPPGVEFPLQAQQPKEPPKKQLCGMVGCKNPKLYNCSKTNIPLCSLACYRKNVLSVRQIMC